MTSQNKNNTDKPATDLNKNVLRASSGKLMSVERAARFLDTQEEFLESLAIRPERGKKEGEEEKR